MKLLTKDKSFYRDYFRLLLFIALQNLVAYSVSLLDNVMLSRYSMDALNGVSLANQVQYLLQMIAGSVGEGVVVIASQYWGKSETYPIKRVIATGNSMGFAVGIAFMGIIAFFPQQILLLLSDSEKAISSGCEYMSVIMFSYPVFCLSTVMIASMRSVENASLGFIINFISLFINLCLNYCLIFGNLGFPEMGVTGAAVATVCARTFELVAAWTYAFRFDRKLKLVIRDLFRYDRLITSDYFRYASPIILSGTTWGMAMFVQTSVIGHLGDAVISANAVAVSVFSVVSVFLYGGGNAAGVLTGKIVGSGNQTKLHEYVRTMQILFLCCGLVSGLIIKLLESTVISLYSLKSAEAIGYAIQFITVLSITSVGSAYQAPCLTGIVRGGGHTKFVLYNDLIFQWLIVLPFSLLGAYVWHLPPVWVFLILKSDQILKCFVAVFEVNSYRWVHKLTRENTNA